MAETKVAYPKHWFVLLTIVCESILLYLFLTALLRADSVFREFWLVICPLIGACLFVLLVPPIVTSHTIDRDWLRLRMGLLIDERIPLKVISEVRETTTRRGGLKVGVGVRYFPITRQLFVTSGFDNLVSLKLGTEVIVGRLRRNKVDEIVLNVNYSRGFMEALDAARGITREV
jgi:hypothetical protein